jgi:hypothetical protein
MRRLILGIAILIGLAWCNSAFACSGCNWYFVYQGPGESDWCMTCDYDLDCGVEVCNIVQVGGWDACETSGNGCFTVQRHCPLEPQAVLTPPARRGAAKLARVRVKRATPRRTVS